MKTLTSFPYVSTKYARKKLRLIILLLAGLVLNIPAFAVDYTITDLGTLGHTHSTANGINNNGQVVGTAYTTGDAANHA